MKGCSGTVIHGFSNSTDIPADVLEEYSLAVDGDIGAGGKVRCYIVST